MITIALANQKGGTSKTHSTHALGVILARRGYRVLLVDMDPQSSLTSATGQSGADGNLSDVLGENATARAVIRPLADNLDLLPGDIALATTELELVGIYGREGELLRALRPLADDYDICLMDCPPSLSLLTINALTAADGVLIPVVPQVQDLRGLNLFLGSLAKIRAKLNPELETIGILPTMHDGRLVHHNDAIEAMTGQGLRVLATRISRSVKVAEAAAAAESIVTYDPAHKITDEYNQLADEVIAWLKSERE